jgi:hypothetical protein
MTIAPFGDTSVYQNGQGKPQEAAGVTLLAGKANWSAADGAITRSANVTPYAAHNSMGSASNCLFTFTNLFPFVGAQALLTGLKLVMGAASVPASIVVRAHLFNDDLSASVLAANADQSTFKTLLASEGAKLGYVDFSSFAIGGSGSDCIESYGTPSVSPLHLVAKATSRNLYAILEATASFTPPSASEMRLYASIAGL